MKFLSSKQRQASVRRRAVDRGFTLIEVVVALALVGITLGVVFQAFTLALTNIRRIDLYHTAMQLAQNKMNELLIDDDINSDAVLEGDWNDTFSWRAALETHEIDDLQVDKSKLTTRLLYIRLTVTYRQQNRSREVKLFTIKMVPKPEVGQRGYFGR